MDSIESQRGDLGSEIVGKANRVIDVADQHNHIK